MKILGHTYYCMELVRSNYVIIPSKQIHIPTQQWNFSDLNAYDTFVTLQFAI